MKKKPARNLKVIHTFSITPNMQRLTLGGEDLSDFPVDQEGAYLKLMFPQEGGSKDLVRTYTIIEQRSDDNELDIDFVLHPPPHGPASSLAKHAKVGDEVLLTGPGPKASLFTDADWFFIGGDMTALPAISVILKNLPEDAKGYVVIEIVEEHDRQELSLPDNMEIHWLIPEADIGLEEKVISLPFLQGSPSVWMACEFSTMRALRKYFKVEREIEKKALYVSSYWKKGLTEDKHKVVKREDNSIQV